MLHAKELVPIIAFEKVNGVKGFPSRWKMIISRLEQIPSKLSDLSSAHVSQIKNTLLQGKIASYVKDNKRIKQLN